MLNERSIARALAHAGLSAPVRWDDVTTSTNETARAMAAAGTPAWTLVAAGHQTRGRGRAGRTWIDRPGAALLCSVVLRPRLEPERLGLVSLAAGVAMAEAASSVAGRSVRCTWPNDLVVDGGKIGGVLAEAKVERTDVHHVVVGVGVNLEAPIGVAGASGIGRVDEEALLAGYLTRLRELLDGDPGGIVRRWRAVNDTVGRRVEATTVDRTVVRGVASGVDRAGALLIDTDLRRVRVAVGDVVHLRDPS